MSVRSGDKAVTFTARQRPLQIWVCGNRYDADGVSVAAYWCNGEQTLMTDAAGERAAATIANGIFVEGDNGYVAGYLSLPGGRIQGVYWERGRMSVIQPTDANAGSVYLSDVCLKDGMLFLTGRDGVNGNTIAQYWLDYEPVPLSDEGLVSNTTQMLCEGGGDLFVGGRNGSTPGYWKNGLFVDLSHGGEGTYVNALFKAGDDLYAAGQYTDVDKYVPLYWKNGEAHPLTTQERANVFGMWVDREDIYLAGSSGLGLDRAAAIGATANAHYSPRKTTPASAPSSRSANTFTPSASRRTLPAIRSSSAGKTAILRTGPRVRPRPIRKGVSSVERL